MSLRLLIAPILFLLLVVTPPQETDQRKPVEDRLVVGLLDPANPDALTFVMRRAGNPFIGSIGIRLFAYRPPEPPADSLVSGQNGRSVVTVEEGQFAASWPQSDLVWYTSFDDKTPVRLRWGQKDQGTIIAQITGPASIRIGIELYQPFPGLEGQAGERTSGGGHTGFLIHPDRRSVLGEIIQSGSRPVRHRYFLLRSDQPPLEATSYLDGQLFRQGLAISGRSKALPGQPSVSSYRQAALIFDLGREGQVSFTAIVGDQWDAIEQRSRTLLRRPLAEYLNEGLQDHLQTFSGSGAVGESIDRLRRFISFNRFFNPGSAFAAGEFLVAERLSESPKSAAARLGPAIDANSLLLAGLSAPYAPALAASTFREILSGQLTDGRVPLSRRFGRAGTSEVTTGRSMMPIGSLVALKLYLATGDLELLAWAFPRLRLWNEWWLNDRGDGQPWRDGDRDGLPEWGYNEELELGSLGRIQLSASARRRLALAEAGTPDNDGSDPPFNEQTSTLEQNSVALGSMLALDTECLALIATELGLTSEAEQLRLRYQRLRELINNRLWDEATGSYVDRRWNGQALYRSAPGSLLPLTAGLSDTAKATRLMSDYSRMLGSPSILERTPFPVNYLLYLGLRRSNLRAEAATFARTLGAQTEGDQRGEMLRRWALIEEIVSLDPLTGLNIGSPETTAESRIEGLQVGENRFDIIHGPKRTTIRRDGKVELECDAAVGLSRYRQQASTLSFTIVSGREVRLSIPGEKGRKLTVSIDNNILGSTSVGAAASFRVPAGTHRVIAIK